MEKSVKTVFNYSAEFKIRVILDMVLRNFALSEDTKHPRNRSDRGMLKWNIRGL